MSFQNFLPCLVDAGMWAAHLFLLSPLYRFKEISNNYNHLAFLEPWEQGAFTDIVITLSILPLLHMAGEPVDQVLQELNLKQANSLRYFKFREILGLKNWNSACHWLIKNLVHFFCFNNVVKSGCTNQKVCLLEIPSFCFTIRKKLINKLKTQFDDFNVKMGMKWAITETFKTIQKEDVYQGVVLHFSLTHSFIL